MTSLGFLCQGHADYLAPQWEVEDKETEASGPAWGSRVVLDPGSLHPYITAVG